MDSRGRRMCDPRVAGPNHSCSWSPYTCFGTRVRSFGIKCKRYKNTLKLRSEPEIRYLTRCQPVQSCAVAFVFSYRPTVCELPTELHLKSKMVTGLPALLK